MLLFKKEKQGNKEKPIKTAVTPKIIKVGNSNDKTVNKAESSTDFHNFDVLFNFYNLKNKYPVEEFIKTKIVPYIEKTLYTLLSVRRNLNLGPFTKSGCEPEVDFDPALLGKTIDKDAIIYVSITESSENFVAYASACALSNLDNRPVIGFIKFNAKHVSSDISKFRELFAVTMHEILHILVLSPNLFEYYYTNKDKITVVNSTNSKGETVRVNKVQTPKLVSFGKSHYNCSTFDGLVLENDGGDGSMNAHFEKILAGNDILVAQINGNLKLTGFILSLLEDSGWYKVNFDLEEPLFWGRGKGCEFVNNTCNTKFTEICTKQGDLGCSPNNQFITYCNKDSFGNGCLLASYFNNLSCVDLTSNHNTRSDFKEFIGPNSRCYQVDSGSSKSAICYKTECVNKRVFFYYGTEKKECKTGDSIIINGVSIVCPDNESFCNKISENCVNDCNGNGSCLVNKKCFCNFPYYGTQCESKFEALNGDYSEYFKNQKWINSQTPIGNDSNSSSVKINYLLMLLSVTLLLILNN